MVIGSWFIIHGSLVNLVNMVNLVKFLNGSVQGRPDLRYLRTMLFGVYLLIRKRAVLRYICRLGAVYVSPMANIRVF